MDSMQKGAAFEQVAGILLEGPATGKGLDAGPVRPFVGWVDARPRYDP